MYTFLIILTILICVLLGAIVLMQDPKGGGLDSSFGGVSNNTFGAKRTTDFLEKATWYLAVALVVTSIASALYIRTNVDKSAADEFINSAPRITNEVEPSTEGSTEGNTEDFLNEATGNEQPEEQ